MHNIITSYKTDRFKIPGPEFFANVDRSHYWFPVELTPWHHLHSYYKLSEPIQRRYNQLYALGTNEVFALFETEFVTHILVKLKRELAAGDPLAEVINNFCAEEEKHAKMFHLLNRTACPEYYSSNKKYHLAQQADRLGILLLDVVKTFPHIFGLWVWIALFFEERSLAYSRYFLKPSNQHLSPAFREIHRLHMLEEAQHVQLDEVFVHFFYRPLSSWKRQMTGHMFQRIVDSYASPRRMSHAIARLLNREFPESAPSIQQCLRELPTLRTNPQFQAIAMGPEVNGRTRKLLRLFPEFDQILLGL